MELRRAIAASLAVMLTGLAAPAWAATVDDQPAAIDLRDLGAWQGRQVTGLLLPGVPDHLRDLARDGLALTPRRKLIGRRLATLTMRTATADARRLRLLLAQHGYPDALVAGHGEADGQRGVEVTLATTPGPLVRYGQITVAGLPSAAAAVADSVRVTLAPGTRFSEQAVQRARQDLLDALHQAGHARSQVTVTATRPAAGSVDLRFACQPGPRFVYRGLVVEGVPADLVPLVRRTVGPLAGAPYRPRIIVEARQHLRQLQLFRQVRLHAAVHDTTELDLVADLRPRAMLTTEASVGTFTDNWLVVRGGVTHRNLLRRGRGVFAGASYAKYRRDAEVRTWWPALLTPRSRTELRVSYEIQDEESYRLDKAEAALSNLFTAWRHSSLRLGVIVSQGVLADRSADPDAFADDVGLQTLLHGIWYRDTSDNPVEPGRGQRLTLQAEWSPPGFWTQAPFSSLRAFGSQYVPLGAERVLALRLDGGMAWPLGDARDLRPDRRWFAGGASSMRGYRRRQLGPLDSEGQPIGGEVRLLASAEARVPVWWVLGAAVFLDGGQVWRRRAETDLAQVELAAGIGLLVGTPVGPLRLDLARHLGTPPPDQPRTLLQFGIGHPF